MSSCGLAAGHQLGAFVTARADVGEDPFALLGRDDGTEVGLGIEPRADARLARPLGERAHDLVELVLVHEQPASGVAGLAGVEVDPHEGARDGRLEVGIGEDDVGRLAAELEGDPLERAPGLLTDLPAHLGRAGEGDLVDARVVDQAAPVSPSPVSTLSTPPGIPASSASSPMRSAVSGVCSAGLSTTVQPAARAGPSFHAAIIMGKFQGMICPHTPTGSLRVYTCMSGWRTGMTSPRIRSAQPAKCRSQATVWLTSTTRASFTGLPLSSDSSSASSPAFASTRSARRYMRRARSAAGAVRHGPSSKRPASRGDGAVDVLGASLRHLGDGLAGAGIDGLEAAAVGRIGALTVDQQLMAL